METRYHKLDLNREENKEYYHLIDKNTVIQRQIKFINDKILRLKQPKFFLICQKHRIKKLFKPLEKVQYIVDSWSKDCTTFMGKPNLTLRDMSEPVVGYLHFTNLLGIIDNLRREKQNTTISNYLKIQERYNNQVNFVIAILSAFISLAGLLFAAYVFFK